VVILLRDGLVGIRLPGLSNRKTSLHD
jgi:hypothetical protein